MENLLQDLKCPITLELFTDPVSVPCCGKAFERFAISEHVSNEARCPLCNGDLSNFDISAAPKNVVLTGLVESLTKIEKTSLYSLNTSIK